MNSPCFTHSLCCCFFFIKIRDVSIVMRSEPQWQKSLEEETKSFQTDVSGVVKSFHLEHSIKLTCLPSTWRHLLVSVTWLWEKNAIRQLREKQLRTERSNPCHPVPSVSAPPPELWAALWWSRQTPESDGCTTSLSPDHGSGCEHPTFPWRGHVPDHRTQTWKREKVQLLKSPVNV